MSTLEVTVSVKRDGLSVPGFPWIRRLEVDESQEFGVERATGGGYVALPTSEMGEVQVLALRSDKQVTLRLDGQSDAGIVINAGGLVLLMDVDIDAGASTNATLDNASGSTALVEGISGGT